MVHDVHHAALLRDNEINGERARWTVNRSASIGNLFARVKKQTLLFPRVADCWSYLDEFAGEFVEYDDQQRSIKYSHPESQPDDSLHAANYALLVGVRQHHLSNAAA